MTLTQLKYIIAIDNYKGFAKASKKLYITQPTLSMQIKKLENELGLLLFDRTRTPVRTTDVGLKIVKQARKIISESLDVYEIINSESDQVSGTFKLAIIPTIAPYLLPRFLEEFIQNNKEVELTIEELKTEKIIEGIRKDEIDAGIVVTPLSHKDITEVPIYYEPFYAYVSQKHKLFKNEKIRGGELDVNDIWLLKEGHCFRDQVVNICSSVNDKRMGERKPLNFEGATLETLVRLVENNFGMTLIPHLLAKELKSTKKVKFIREFKNPIPKREISIIYQRSFLKKKIILRLQEEIIKHISSELTNKKSGYIVELN